MWRAKLYWSPEKRGIHTPNPADAYRIRPEQSKPVMLAPSPTPLLGPCSVPPPQEYGTPICDPARLITYSIACRPLARGIRLGLVLPGSAAGVVPPRLIPSPPRNCLPRSTVVWVACAVACSEALATASGSPGAPALTVAGSVGSPWPGSAVAGLASEKTKANISPVTVVVIQARLIRRNRLRRIAPRLDVNRHHSM